MALDDHKMKKSHAAYNDAIKRCQETWAKIIKLEKSPVTENSELLHLKDGFILVLCADYHQSKLVPYWGSSPQPGMMYYLRKLS